jgi:glyoxylase-like metal-dependent hydrolase (beta-lactamase superfamily II)
VLVAGDALTAEGGRLNGPNPPLTLDVGEAARSVRRLAEVEVETIVCYHGGVVDDDANGQLRRVLRETPTAITIMIEPMHGSRSARSSRGHLGH